MQRLGRESMNARLEYHDAGQDLHQEDCRLKYAAAVGAGSVVCRMQMVEEEVDVAPNLRAETSEVLLPDGGAQSQMERELEGARLKYARQQLWEEGYSSAGGESDGYEGCAGEMPSTRTDSCNSVRNRSAEMDGAAGGCGHSGMLWFCGRFHTEYDLGSEGKAGSGGGGLQGKPEGRCVIGARLGFETAAPSTREAGSSRWT